MYLHGYGKPTLYVFFELLDEILNLEIVLKFILKY